MNTPLNVNKLNLQKQLILMDKLLVEYPNHVFYYYIDNVATFSLNDKEYFIATFTGYIVLNNELYAHDVTPRWGQWRKICCNAIQDILNESGFTQQHGFGWSTARAYPLENGAFTVMVECNNQQFLTECDPYYRWVVCGR